jgi:23S rRNA pseudouridine2605 synthase
MHRPPNSHYRRPPVRRVGLARTLSKLGFCSRARAAELIRAGQVKLNGTVRRDPETPVRPGIDRLAVDGAEVRAAAKIYLMLNKPRGVITTAADEQGRVTVYDYLPESQRLGSGHGSGSVTSFASAWLAPVGRLDKASEGLLLLTNDSEWAARLTAPDTHLDKMYHVQIAQLPSAPLLAALQSGVCSEGQLLRCKRAVILRHGDKTSWLEITLDEGKNRHIRRMFESLEIEVLRLIRVAIGPLALGNLPKKGTRELTPAEKFALDQAMQRSNQK